MVEANKLGENPAYYSYHEIRVLDIGVNPVSEMRGIAVISNVVDHS